MNLNHQFGPLQHTDPYNDHPYRKCQRCGKVMFIESDPYFNMICGSAGSQMEDLRKKLEDDRNY